MQEFVKSHLINFGNIPLSYCRRCFFAGLKTSSSSTTQKSSSPRRRRATKPKTQPHSSKEAKTSLAITEPEKGDGVSVQETEPNNNQFCLVPEEMKSYISWLQQGLVTDENSANSKQEDSKRSEQEPWERQHSTPFNKVDQRVYWSRWQELFQLPGARYQSLDDERLLVLNKCSHTSRTRVLLLMENKFII